MICRKRVILADLHKKGRLKNILSDGLFKRRMINTGMPPVCV
ncbi:hypothetical protein NEIFL0001_2348 [Neisseria flavescens SK114]|nr:hypothetical protein NEIFL0001_2348 [Neisseria flavescens SK114]